jgi:hypothetical protein
MLEREKKNEPPAVAIVVPLGAFLLALSIVGLLQFSSLRREKQRHETLRLMIEKGATLPPELLVPPRKPRSDFRSGLGLLAVGTGLMLMLRAIPTGPGVWTAGLIPFFLGLARLLAWKFDRSRNAQDDGASAES